MKLKLLCTFALLFIFSTYNGTAQSQKKQIEKTVKYKDNINTPLTAKELACLKEVYADKFEDYVLKRPEYLKYLKHLLRNRIEIVDKPELILHKDKYQLLSEVGLFNNYNNNLTMDIAYDPETFNVLKYNVRYHGSGASIYRIDDTSQFIIIKSQHQ